MKHAIQFVFTVFVVIFIAITSIIMFFVNLLIWTATILFDKKLTALHYTSSFWGSMYLWVIPSWKISVLGRDKFKRGERYVMVSNHQSQLDILIAFNLFLPFKWVSKLEMFRVPFIGWNMYLNQYIGLERGSTSAIRKMLVDCEKTLSKGCSVFMFPEGTRSDTDELRKFASGAFSIAQKMKVPILPVVIIGTRDALPKNNFTYSGKKHLQIKVLAPIPYEEHSKMKPHEVAVKTRDIIIEEIAKHS